ncbi:MAG: sulfite exporter TauE/SafE family protein [Gloeomargaritaceae cyanobacterium C42_A2020_066]|nr:sulfite exporter TauE/SafE family protein [Gloeomargaritaceae cyanobacterium C42_A2020_066]
MTQDASAHLTSGDPSLLHLLAPEALTPTWVITGLAVAVVLGAGHGLLPGHGKTLAATYLAGTRSTAWHAVLLGLTTTLTHTLAVFGLGVLALVAAQGGWSDQIYPVLSAASGLVIVAVGSGSLRQHLQHLGSTETEDHTHADHEHGHTHGYHTHDHALDSANSPNLIALGIAGGLVPCPSALVLLLSAVALHQTVYGLALVAAFSLGLALVLVAVGLSVVYSRKWLDHLPVPTQVLRYFPIASAVMMMAIGAVLTAQAMV